MNKNYIKRSRARQISTGLFIGIVQFIIYSFAIAQTSCPNPGGGTNYFVLSSSPSPANYYPGAVPSGKSGTARSTSGRLFSVASMQSTYGMRRITIHPELPGNFTGNVVLRFDLLSMNAPAAEIAIYRGTAATGAPVETITASNAASFLRQTRVYSGPVTVTFKSTTAVQSGRFDIQITYTTGDQVINTAFGSKVAAWTQFITPEAYTAIDSHAGTVAPISTGYFDANRQFVSSEISFCLDAGKPAPLIGMNNYPGQIIFTPKTRPDMDKSGIVDGVDELKSARLVYLMQNAPQPITSKSNFDALQAAVHKTTGADYATNNGGLHGSAIDAIPSLPNPSEPIFSIVATGRGIGPSAVVNFLINLEDDGNYLRRFKLEIPDHVSVNSINGGSYKDGYLEFSEGTKTVSISTTSSIAQTATLKLIYDQPNFWNVKNLIVYEPCTGISDFQGFIGLSKGDIIYPHREVTASWINPPLPVTLLEFEATTESESVNLSWATTTEANSRAFEVERSSDTKSWKLLGELPAAGESEGLKQYHFSDVAPESGINYYRLKMVDLDNSFAYSTIRSVKVNMSAMVVVYPNPAVHKLFFKNMDATKLSSIEIYDQAGICRLVKHTLIKDGIDVTELTAGNYNVRIRMREGNVVSRIIAIQK